MPTCSTCSATYDGDEHICPGSGATDFGRRVGIGVRSSAQFYRFYRSQTRQRPLHACPQHLMGRGIADNGKGGAQI